MVLQMLQLRVDVLSCHQPNCSVTLPYLPHPLTSPSAVACCRGCCQALLRSS
jgi:hypothetical protein